VNVEVLKPVVVRAGPVFRCPPAGFVGDQHTKPTVPVEMPDEALRMIGHREQRRVGCPGEQWAGHREAALTNQDPKRSAGQAAAAHQNDPRT
jgi:hypothetical protein